MIKRYRQNAGRNKSGKRRKKKRAQQKNNIDRCDSKKSRGQTQGEIIFTENPNCNMLYQKDERWVVVKGKFGPRSRRRVPPFKRRCLFPGLIKVKKSDCAKTVKHFVVHCIAARNPPNS